MLSEGVVQALVVNKKSMGRFSVEGPKQFKQLIDIPDRQDSLQPHMFANVHVLSSDNILVVTYVDGFPLCSFDEDLLPRTKDVFLESNPKLIFPIDVPTEGF